MGCSFSGDERNARPIGLQDHSPPAERDWMQEKSYGRNWARPPGLEIAGPG
jgi:hypothetical protein